MTITAPVSNPTQLLKIIPREYEVFAGLDVDHHSIAATFADHGELLHSLRLPYSATQLLNYVAKHFPGQRLAFAFEAGPTGFGLYDELVAHQHTCLVVAPPMVPQVPGRKVKTNRLDSRKLAVSLRGGELESIHVPPPQYRELRHLVQLRDSQIKQLTASKCRIKALLLYEGIPFPAKNGKELPWSAAVLAELLALPCSSAVRFKLDQLIGTLQFHFYAAAATQKQIRHYCQHDPELRQAIAWLKSLPGIGEIVATHLVARLGDPTSPTCGRLPAFSVWSPASTPPATNSSVVRSPAPVTAACATSWCKAPGWRLERIPNYGSSIAVSINGTRSQWPRAKPSWRWRAS